MKVKLIIALIILITNNTMNGQNNRFIEVTGSSEMEVAPDEIRFQISMQEYFKEAYEKGKDYDDYITKIPIKGIKENVMLALNKIGIKKEQIILKDVGKHWNGSGKDFKKSLDIELILIDFNLINKLLNNINVKGVSSMRIVKLNNKNSINYRQQVKIEALKAAREKAKYLLESLDESIGKLISVIEINNSNFIYQPTNLLSNSIISSNTSETKNLRTIKLRYEFNVKYEIK